MKLKLVRLIKFVSILRIFIVIITLIFTLLLIFSSNELIAKKYATGLLICIILFAYQYILVKRYKPIGEILFEKDKISINKNNTNLVFNLEEVFNTIVKYYGFKGEFINFNPFFLKDGVSKIEFTLKNNVKSYFYFILEKSDKLKFDQLKKEYSTFNIRFRERYYYLYLFL